MENSGIVEIYMLRFNYKKSEVSL